MKEEIVEVGGTKLFSLTNNATSSCVKEVAVISPTKNRKQSILFNVMKMYYKNRLTE